MYIFAYMGITPHTQHCTGPHTFSLLEQINTQTQEYGQGGCLTILVSPGMRLIPTVQTCSMILLAIISFASQASDRSHN